MRFLLLFLFAGLLCNSCTNPVDHISVVVDGNLIQYKSTITLTDASGAVLPNTLTVKITGQDSASIYDYSGAKLITATSGIITIGITPDAEPTIGTATKFNVVISGTNYQTTIIPVVVSVGQKNLLFNAALLNLSVPAGATVKTKTITALAGKLTLPDTLITATTAAIPERTTLIQKAGSTFENTADEVITAPPLIERLIHYSTENADFLSMFPGASYGSTNLTAQDGSVGSAFMFPAGFSSVSMTIHAQLVSASIQPFQLNMEINPNYKPQTTSQIVKAGDKLAIYSYNYTTGGWKYESPVTVSTDKYGKLAVSFTSSIPGGFFVGDVTSLLTCQPISFKFIAPWLGAGTQPVNLQIWTADGLTKLSDNSIQAADGLTKTISTLPAVAMLYKVISSATNVVLATGSITNPCLGQQISVVLNAPGGTVDNVTFTLGVSCPGIGTITPPNFDLYYKLSSSTDDFQLLGTVQGGTLKTTALKVGSTYDFRVIFGTKVTLVNSRTIAPVDATGTSTQSISIIACSL